MPVIKTKRNKVVADDPEPGDIIVQVAWRAPTVDGKHQRFIHMPWRPISEYDEAIDWAASIADQMAHPIYVLPLSHRDILARNRFNPYQEFLANLTEPEHVEVRQILVDSCTALMRDCDDPAVRAEAYDYLQTLGVVGNIIGIES